MRKDLRVGLGIGGVLLAVLVVAIIVRSHGKDKTRLAKVDPAAQPDTGEATGEPTPPPGDGTGTQPNPSPESLAGGAPGDGPAARSTTPSSPTRPAQPRRRRDRRHAAPPRPAAPPTTGRRSSTPATPARSAA